MQNVKKTLLSSTVIAMMIFGSMGFIPKAARAENRLIPGLSEAEQNYIDITTLGTGAASKAVVLDASGDYTYPATASIVMPSGGTWTANSGSTVDLAGTFKIGGVTLSATAAELNNAADLNSRFVTSTGTAQVLTVASNEGVVTFVSAGGSNNVTVDLPDSSAGEGKIDLVFTSVPSGSGTVTVRAKAATNATILGDIIRFNSGDSLAYSSSHVGTSNDSLVFNSSGLEDYDRLSFINYASGGWAVEGETRFESAGSNNGMEDVGTEIFQTTVN